MNITKYYLTNNACYKEGRIITPKGIMVHSTGANNSNLCRYVGPDDGILGPNKYNNHWNQDTPEGRSVCVHAFIGKLADGSVAIYQTLPWNMKGWHGGGLSNDTHIGFEICEDDLTDNIYFGKVYQKAVELCAYLCIEFKLDPLTDGVLICHSEGYKRGIASNHSDVMHWFPKHGKNMDTFRQDVADTIENLSTAETGGPAADLTDMYKVRKAWSDEKSQKGAFTILSNAKACADQNAGYKVYDSKGNCIYASAESVSTTPEAQVTSNTVDVKYQVYAASWLPWVTNYNNINSYGYAGIPNKPITAISIENIINIGRVKYRTHLKDGNWLPWVYGVSEHAGIYGKEIDCVQIDLLDSNEYTIEYRVSLINGNYYGWVKSYNEKDINGYAGVFGKAIDRLQIRIVKK